MGPRDSSGPRVCIVAPFPPRNGGVAAQAGLLASYLERDGARVVRLDTTLESFRGPILKLIRPLVQPLVIASSLVAKLRAYDTVHFLAASYWGFMPAAVGVPLAALLHKRPIVSFLGGMGAVFLDRLGWLAKPVFRMAAATTVCSRQLYDAFGERGIDAVLLNNIYESELFTFRQRDRIEPKLVWTRCFEEDYDPMMAVRAFEIVSNKFPSASLVMTSDGSLLRPVRDYVSRRGIRGVTLLGRLPREGVAQAMQEADICINTSRLDGLPTALLEAAGTGLPIVSTAVGGIPTVFEDGVSAVLVPTGDHEAMAAAVIGLLESPARAVELGKRARRVAEEHSWEHSRQKLMALYCAAKEGEQ